MNHFVHTLTELYQVKVNWLLGSRYLGMDININRRQHHVTLTMPGYVDKLLRKICPDDGIKGANTPAHYTPPNYSNPGAHKATVDASPLASEHGKKITIFCTIPELSIRPFAQRFMNWGLFNPNPLKMI
jgi:hypothetical protein